MEGFVSRPIGGAFVVFAFVVSACGPSAESICEARNSSSCPAGQVATEEPTDICIQDQRGECGDLYRMLMECQTQHPTCMTKNPDGSLSYTPTPGPVPCADEHDAWFSCLCKNGFGGSTCL